jgi:hypothetical protein
MFVLYAYQNTWTLCLGLIAFLAVLCGLAQWLRLPGGKRMVNPRLVFWPATILWLVAMSVITTLIDSPYLPVSHEAIVWLFMLSAFLGLPLTVPPFALAIWSLHAAARGERVRLSTLCLLSLGAFALGAFTSNMHDVLWCGIITHGYSQPYPAGGDLAFFYAVARLFPIPEKIYADYATFGSCMIIMVLGELALAAVCLRRVFRIEAVSKEQ